LGEVLKLLDRGVLSDDIRELASIAREVASEHGRSIYGELDKGLIPDEIYSEKHAKNFIAKARRVRGIVLKIFRELNISLYFS